MENTTGNVLREENTTRYVLREKNLFEGFTISLTLID